MHARSQTMPSQAQLVFPLLDMAREAGGRVTSKEAYDELARRHSLSAEIRERSEVLQCGQRHNLWERHVRFARERAKAAGYLTSQSLGVWELTDEGKDAVDRAEAAVVIRVVTDGAKNPVGAQIELNVGLPTVHSLHLGDARDLSWIGDQSIPLVVTSIPYFDLKEYEHVDGQLADIRSYDDFVAAMAEAMRECYRVLIPGGRMAVNVGNVLRSRGKNGGVHEVLPLSADLTVSCRRIGFNALTGIIWQKMANCRYEQGRGGVLGQPGMPRMCIKAESEDILFFKKPGAHFHATREQREASRIAKADWQKWVRSVWSDIPGARATAAHPAPYPVEVPYRLIRMLSYTGPEPHTVLDPFGGSFQTSIAAMRAQRSSASVEIAPTYFRRGIESLRAEAERLRDLCFAGDSSFACEGAR